MTGWARTSCQLHAGVLYHSLLTYRQIEFLNPPALPTSIKDFPQIPWWKSEQDSIPVAGQGMILLFLSLSGRALTWQHKLILTGITTDGMLKCRVVEQNPETHSFQYIFYLSSRCLEWFWSCSWAPLNNLEVCFFFFWLEISKAKQLVALRFSCVRCILFCWRWREEEREEYWIICSCWWQSQAALGDLI